MFTRVSLLINTSRVIGMLFLPLPVLYFLGGKAFFKYINAQVWQN